MFSISLIPTVFIELSFFFQKYINKKTSKCTTHVSHISRITWTKKRLTCNSAETTGLKLIIAGIKYLAFIGIGKKISINLDFRKSTCQKQLESPIIRSRRTNHGRIINCTYKSIRNYASCKSVIRKFHSPVFMISIIASDDRPEACNSAKVGT